MIKGLYIMLIVFAVVAILAWVMNKLGKVSDSVRKKYMRGFFIGYGILLLVQAGLTQGEGLDFFNVLLGLFGVFFLWHGLFGKKERTSKS